MIRNEAVKGLFYKKDQDSLTSQIKSCFSSNLVKNDRKGKIFGIISPHAGYIYSGKCAAHVFEEIAKSEVSDIYFLIGPNHYSYGSAFSSFDWKTPFGLVKCDNAFVKSLSDMTNIPIDEDMHSKEHSIEVQLPFLQYANKCFEKDFKIVCLTVSHDIDIHDVSSKIKDFIKKSNKSVTFIISSDFTHYGNRFGYSPFSSDVKKNLKRLDNEAINLILKKDFKGFDDYIKKTGATICGYIPILIFLNVLNKDVKGELLCYYNSSEVSDDSNTVSYAGIVFK